MGCRNKIISGAYNNPSTVSKSPFFEFRPIFQSTLKTRYFLVYFACVRGKRCLVSPFGFFVRSLHLVSPLGLSAGGVAFAPPIKRGVRPFLCRCLVSPGASCPRAHALMYAGEPVCGVRPDLPIKITSFLISRLTFTGGVAILFKRHTEQNPAFSRGPSGSRHGLPHHTWS